MNNLKFLEEQLPDIKVSYGIATKENGELLVKSRRFGKEIPLFPEKFKKTLNQTMKRLDTRKLHFAFAWDEIKKIRYYTLAINHPNDMFCYKIGRQIVLGRMLRLENRLKDAHGKPKKAYVIDCPWTYITTI